jgi:hypothetical protein
VKNIALQHHFNTHTAKWEDLNAAYNKRSKVTKPIGNPKRSTMSRQGWTHWFKMKLEHISM